jgi:hypothetical protein
MPTSTPKPKKQTVLAKLHQILLDHQHVYLSTVDLHELGIFSPAASISGIKASGVTIDTVYRSITDPDGTVHKRVAFYKMTDEVLP